MLTKGGRSQTNLLTVHYSGTKQRRQDVVVGEEPLEIRLDFGGDAVPFTVTMRTPGNDFDLVAGLLFSEGIVADRYDIADIRYCNGTVEEQNYNVVVVKLRNAKRSILPNERSLVSTSACGVCGKATIDDLHQAADSVPDTLTISPEGLISLVDVMRAKQFQFDRTGGIHGAAIFRGDLTLSCLREDVGRHNAVDKAIGSLFLDQTLARGKVMLVSGRAGYEIIQKAIVAKLELVASVSAPSSLAVDLAKDFGMTLVGFLRDSSFNIYTHEHRIT